MKKGVHYTVDKTVKDNFVIVCKAKSINMSLWIENKMKELIEENKELLKK